MNNYRNSTYRTKVKHNKKLLFEGTTIEQTVDKLVKVGQSPETTETLIYSQRKDGVLPDTDIRTDRFEIASNALGEITKANLAKRDKFVLNINKETDA